MPALVDALACLGSDVPCSCADLWSYLSYGRDVLNYLAWAVSTGYTFSPRLATARIFRIYLVGFFIAECCLLYLHLLQGVVDSFEFVLGSLELMVCTCSLALQTDRQRSRFAGGLTASVYVGLLLLTTDLVGLAYFWAEGHEAPLVKVDFVVKLAAYFMFTSLPFYAMDKELSIAHSSLTFVWKLWFIEAVDFGTIAFGAIEYAQNEHLESRRHLLSAAGAGGGEEGGAGGRAAAASARRLGLFDWLTDDTLGGTAAVAGTTTLRAGFTDGWIGI